ncbi:MAG: Rieske 2Fe-2S domain-containing protein [Caldilinea sp.]|nr:Rieske 2Fe-2S domain-containing protein [Caldilinea sp.]MDW8440734.1 Rieske 2Fe-2S domain-containing protein [Caldilineaceae bacterium]
MADQVADMSGDDRAKRIAELKAKMQAAAQKAKAAAEHAPEQPATQTKPQQPAPVAEAVQEAPRREVVAEAEKREGAPAGSSPTNGASGNGAAAKAEVLSAEKVATPAPAFVEESPEEKARKEMNRREFLTYAWGGLLGLVTLQSAVGLFLFMMPRFKEGEFGGIFRIGPESSLPPTDAPPKAETAGKFWLVNTTEEGPVALYMVCTHLGCLYKWEQANNRFECPCHGSKFTREGYYIEGPAPRSLDRFEITVEEGEVLVNTGRRILGAPAAESPARAVPA